MAPELTAPLKSANGSRASRRGKTKTFPKKERQGRACSASRWSAIGGRERAEERFYLTRSGPLMEAATVGSGCCQVAPPAESPRGRDRETPQWRAIGVGGVPQVFQPRAHQLRLFVAVM